MKNPPFTANYGPITSTGANPGVPNIFLKDGLPVVEFASPDQPTGNVIGTDINYKSDRAKQFNLMLEKEFEGNVVTAGYIGRAVTGCSKACNYNLAPAGGRRRGSAAAVFLAVSTNGERHRAVERRASSTYNAAQFVFNRRYRGGPYVDHALHLVARPANTAGRPGTSASRDGRHAETSTSGIAGWRPLTMSCRGART